MPAAATVVIHSSIAHAPIAVSPAYYSTVLASSAPSLVSPKRPTSIQKIPYQGHAYSSNLKQETPIPSRDGTSDTFWTKSFVHTSLALTTDLNTSRGVCVIATEPIPAGTLLMREPPLLSLPSWALTVPGLRQQWQALDEKAKIKFWHLAAGGFHSQAVHSASTGPNGLSFANVRRVATPAMRKIITNVPIEPQVTKKVPNGGNSNSRKFDSLDSHWTDPRVRHPWARMLGLAHLSDKPSVLRVFATNAIALPAAGRDGGVFDGWGEGGAGIFECISRVNHSCVPNTTLWFKHDDREDNSAGCSTSTYGGFTPDLEENHGVMELRATRALAKGEELFITYTDPYQSRDRRLDGLSPYGFVCACPACDPNSADPLPPKPNAQIPEDATAAAARLSPNPRSRQEFFQASLLRRARIEEIDNTLPSSGRFLIGGSQDIRTNSIAASRLRYAIEMVGLLKQESLLGARLARLYLDVACLTEFLGDTKHAYMAAKAAMPHYQASVGPTHRYYIQAQRMVDRLRQTWECDSSAGADPVAKV